MMAKLGTTTRHPRPDILKGRNSIRGVSWTMDPEQNKSYICSQNLHVQNEDHPQILQLFDTHFSKALKGIPAWKHCSEREGQNSRESKNTCHEHVQRREGSVGFGRVPTNGAFLRERAYGGLVILCVELCGGHGLPDLQPEVRPVSWACTGPETDQQPAVRSGNSKRYHAARFPGNEPPRQKTAPVRFRFATYHC